MRRNHSILTSAGATAGPSTHDGVAGAIAAPNAALARGDQKSCPAKGSATVVTRFRGEIHDCAGHRETATPHERLATLFIGCEINHGVPLAFSAPW